MSDDHDEAPRIVYDDEDVAGSVEEHGQTAPFRRQKLQALLAAQVQHEDRNIQAGFAKGQHQAPATRCHEPLEEPHGAAYRAPLPSPRSLRLQQGSLDAAAAIQNRGEPAATALREATHLPLHPKPTKAELKAEIAASKPHRHASAFSTSICLHMLPVWLFLVLHNETWPSQRADMCDWR